MLDGAAATLATRDATRTGMYRIANNGLVAIFDVSKYELKAAKENQEQDKL